MAATPASDYKIEILGVNWDLDITSSNGAMTNGRDLPWLQDTRAENAQAKWGANYRDVIILDPANERPVAAFSLNTYDLRDDANRTLLKDVLLGVAQLADQDDDKLSDFWEREMFSGQLSEEPSGDKDSDSAISLSEYAHGSHANSPASLPAFKTGILEVAGQRYLSITFRRRLGAAGGLHYIVEYSGDLKTWESGPAAAVEAGSSNPYDGTGTEIVTYRSVSPITSFAPPGFLRVRCTLP